VSIEMNLAQSGAVATAVGPHLFWITSRAAGIAALLLSSLSVCIGLLMGGKLARRSGPDLRVVHEALSLATLAALLVHGLTLLGDSFLHPSLADVSVPFAGSYKTFWTSTGIVAFWALALLGLSYYVRGRIGVARWRKLHRFTALAWALGVVHSLGEGTDAGQTWFLAMTAIAVVPALVLLVLRTVTAMRRRGAAPVTAGARAAGADIAPADGGAATVRQAAPRPQAIA
jgi:methionine sulfoxide reductase heme-binding subunit